MLIQF